jgi:integrase
VRADEKPRRPKGTGSLRHIDGDRWQVTIKIGSRRLSRTFIARNATEANRNADAVRVELMADSSRVVTDDDVEREQRRKWNVEQYFGYYFEKWAAFNLAATTRRRYRQLLKNQVLPHMGKRLMTEVTPSDLSRLYATLAEPESSKRKGQSLSGLTIWHVHRFIEAVYTFAVEVEGDFESNPARKTRPQIARESRKPPAVDVAEVERFLAVAREHAPELYPALMVPAHLGTRRGETMALRWSDIDLDGGSVTVRRSAAYTQEEGLVVKSTKTGKVRSIPLDPDTASEFKAQMTAQRKRRVFYGPAWRGEPASADDYVCANHDGSPMNPDRYSYAFREFAIGHGFAHVTPHVLRHAWVSQMIALGFDAVTIAAMSGHSPEVLLATYAHAFDSRKREAMNALAEARRQARAE